MRANHAFNRARRYGPSMKGESGYRVWRPGELTAAILALLLRKDAKTYRRGPFAELYVCLFADEPALTVEIARSELGSAVFGPFNQI